MIRSLVTKIKLQKPAFGIGGGLGDKGFEAGFPQGLAARRADQDPSGGKEFYGPEVNFLVAPEGSPQGGRVLAKAGGSRMMRSNLSPVRS